MTNNIDLFINRYRQYMQILNRSDETINRYIYILNYFANFLSQIGVFDIHDLNKQHILQYQKENFYYLNRRGQQNLPQTQNNQTKAVKSFCYFLYSEGYLSHNPAKDILYAKTPQQLPKTILTHQEIKKLLRQPDIHTPLGYRDRAILEVLYSTGIRKKELLNLKPQDADCEKGFLRINQGKGQKDRIVPLGKIACKYLENYIKLVRLDWARIKQSPYLFLSLRGNRIASPTLKQMIYKYVKKAKIGKRVSAHVFRHTCATHLIQKKANIRCVQEILGHKHLDSTQIYTQITIDDLKQAHQSCHPREKDENY